MQSDSAAAYEENARSFLRGRDQSLIGSLVVEQWCRTLRDHAEVLELGCGGGYPITRTLREAGLKVWGIDSSPTLVEAFTARFPDIPAQCAKVQESDFFERAYDAIIAIGLLFLLTEQDQIYLIEKVSRFIIPGGRFLFTAPIETGSWTDINTGIECRSIGRAAYLLSLERAGFQLLATFTDKGANNYYDMQRLA